MASYDVEIPGKGTFRVESPTELNDSQVYQAALGQANAPPTATERAARVAGLGARSVVRGLTAIPTLMAEGVAAPLRMATGGRYFQSPSAVLERTMTQAGLPEPETMPERFATGVTSAMTGVGSQLGAFNALRPTSPVGEGIRQTLIQQPGRQVVAGGTGAASAQTAAEMGAGPVGQAAAGMAGSMVPFIPGMYRGAPTAETLQRNEAIARGQREGLRAVPSQVNPSLTNKALVGLSGKAASEQSMSIGNQPTVNALVKRAIGVADDVPLNQSTLETVRTQASAPYREIAGISPSAKQYLEQLKEARFNANEHFKHYNSGTGGPDALAKARAAASEAERIENLFERFANSLGRPQLIDELRAGRARIAKTYEIDRALNSTTGDIDSRLLGKALDRGAPLTGELKTVAQFQQAAPGSMLDMSGKTPPFLSPLDAAASTIPLIASAMSGKPELAILAGLPFARPVARGLITSGPYQSIMAQPNLSTLSSMDAASLGLLSGMYGQNR